MPQQKLVSLIPVYGDVYLLQHYVIKFVSDLWVVGCFSSSTPVPSFITADSHDIAIILLEELLNTKNLNPKMFTI